jgi:hypothetical protein
MICQIVQQAFREGYLSAETEEQLRQLFRTGCDLDEIDALTYLQYGVMSGRIKRESQACQAATLLSDGVLSR